MSLSTRCLGKQPTKSQKQSHQTRPYKNKSRSSKISTRDESYDSLLGETNNEASITSNLTQDASKINNSSRQEFINSIVEAAIAKTIAEEKGSTLEESSDPLIGEEKKKQKYKMRSRN